jgi:hypothetical protein
MYAEACALEETCRPWPEGAALPCPRCGRGTTSLKRYRMYDFVLFLWVAFSWQTATYAACPPCMRKLLGWRALLNAVPANALWPVVLLLHGALALASYTQGHSRGVVRALRGQG